MTITYLRLTENNDWEGETWHVYLPVAGNETALNALRELIHNADDDFGFSLSEQALTEDEVDILVRHGGDTTYLSAHTKLSGRLSIVDNLEKLYKGQIADFVSESA